MKLYKTVITVTVLSDYSPYDPDDLSEVAADILDGGCSGDWAITERKELEGAARVAACLAIGTDPGYFGIEEGE